MENANLNNILTQTDAVNKMIGSMANSILNDLALDPDNSLHTRMMEDLLKSRVLLAGVDLKIVKALAPKNPEYLKQAQKNLQEIKAENNSKMSELESSSQRLH